MVVNPCSVCSRLDRENSRGEDGEPGFCTSFPGGIPEEVWTGRHGHLVPIANEDVFDPLPGFEDDHAIYVEAWEALWGEKVVGLTTEVESETVES